MVSSAINEGVRGLQNSQRELQRSAADIARANIRETPREAVDNAPPSALQPVQETQESAQRGIEESLIELRRQEQIFTANAQVVSVAEQTLGSLIDVKS